ncbi:MAG: DUF2341 domain-containing protein [bacterium]
MKRNCVLVYLTLAILLIPTWLKAADWWNANYSYRRNVTITNNGSSNLEAGYSLKVSLNTASLVTAGKMLATGNDLRLVYWNGTSNQELDRDLINPNTTATDVWFKTQVVIGGSSSDTSYYIYYGFPGAGSPPASKNQVYMFFDDFNEGNADGWTPIFGSWSVIGGEYVQTSTVGRPITYAGDAAWTDYVLEATGVMTGGYPVLEFMGRYTDTLHYYLLGLNNNLDNNGEGPGFELHVMNGGMTQLSAPDGSTFSLGTYYRMKLALVGTQLKARYWPVGGSEPAGWMIEIGDSALSAGRIALNGYGTSTKWDDIQVRKYSLIENSGHLAVMAGSEEQKGVTDTDGDGIPDTADNCPSTPNPGQTDTDTDGIGDACDTDDDNDGVLDGADNCPLVFNPGQTDTDTDGIGDVCDTDDDNDGVLDGADNCPLVFNPAQTDTDTDGIGDACDTDDDNDGVLDGADNCPLVFNPGQTDTDTDGIGDACEYDSDGDGAPDTADNCPSIPNPGQTDTDTDGIGDACDTDDDNDGVLDGVDNCPLVSNPGQTDTDSDGIGDACEYDSDGDGAPDTADNCPSTPNPGQTDTDTDGIGDACDTDDDNDGLLDGADNCPLVSNPGQTDTDTDGIGDACDTDDDNDGVLDGVDNCPLVSNPGQEDTDGDGTGDVCDSTPALIPSMTGWGIIAAVIIMSVLMVRALRRRDQGHPVIR